MAKEEKMQQVEQLKKVVDSYATIAIVDMHKLPSKQLQNIQKKIRGKAVMKMTKKSLLKLAIKGSSKQNKEELLKIIPQQPAIVFTNEDAFKFYMLVDKMKSAAPAKEGDVAPNDIFVSAGPTNLMPGPAITELTKAGIPAGVEDGKIAVKKDVVVAKKGDKISKALAPALRKLNIEPMLVGLNIVGIYQDGMIYSKEALGFANTFQEKLKVAFSNALSLSVAVCYPTRDSIKYLLAKAYNIADVFEKKFEEKVGGAK